MTIKSADFEFETIRAAADIAAERACLRCGTHFWSEGFGQRICTRCKGSSVWRSAVSECSGQGRRRTGARLS
jgi:hypothetical protein